MAKREIVGAIGPIGGIVYRAGMEDQLAAAARAEKMDLSKFTGEGGPLSGDWGGATSAGTGTGFNVNDATREELEAEAERRGITVTRGDGQDGAPLKADYVKALS